MIAGFGGGGVAVLLIATLMCPCATGERDEGIVVEVTGGGECVSDWVVEQEMDLSAAGRLLGVPVGERAVVAVVEIDGSGKTVGVKCSQVDEGERPGSQVVSWVADGELSPGQTRRFRIELGTGKDMPAPPRSIKAHVEGAKCEIRNAPWTVTHDANMGGFISELRIDGEGEPTRAPLTWSDKIYDGKVYHLGNHKASRTRLLAGGPLRAVYELTQEYRGEDVPSSRPAAVYRWTSLAGMPVTRVDVTITQENAKPWRSLHVIEIHFDKAPITQATTDKASTPGNFMTNHWGNDWSAVFGTDVLIAALRARGNGIHGGRRVKGGYGSYIRADPAETWSGTEKHWQAYLLWGAGGDDLDEVRRWNRILASPPRVNVHFRPLQEGIAGMEKDLAELDTDPDQPIERVARLLAGMKLRCARAEVGSGRFANAQKALAGARSALDRRNRAGSVETSGIVVAGVLGGNAFIENEKVRVVFADVEKGAGIIGIQDRATGREFLKPDLTGSPMWRAAFRQEGGGGRVLSSEGLSCKVSVATDDDLKEAALTFDWSKEGAAVRVTVRLREGEALVRARIDVRAERAEYGLTQVVFPEVAGIAPLTPGAGQDYVLDTREVGDQVASPLRSGANVCANYPCGLQFNAVYGGGQGVYFAEEDPEACSKKIEFLPGSDGDTLTFQITHPVLNYAAPELVKEYSSPGDIVIGPFDGDWYDACQIYRRWAAKSAPWCKNGPIATNEDFPKWLADASYWTISYADNDKNIQDRSFGFHEFFGVPGHIMHLYQWYFPYTQDDRYPEYFPPRQGPENFVALVKRWHEAGMRVVPYVNGSLWDTDTESYRTKDVVRNGALLDARGVERFSQYGGQKHVAMCPATRLWRETMLDVSKELVGRYGVDGVYFDFLNAMNYECFAAHHGHPLGGGNFWSKSVQDLYRLIRTECKALNSDCMLTGENLVEPFIGLLDAFYCSQGVQSRAPLYMAVYHDYAPVFAGQATDVGPINTGRTFILGKQNGWYDIEGRLAYDRENKYKKEADYYKMLLQCHDRFARPYLSYGRMLRIPTISGDFPMVHGKGMGGYETPAVDGSAWRSPDGRVGIFIANYDDKPYEFTWEVDLAEAAGWDGERTLRMSRWTPDGVQALGEIKGGILTQQETLDGWGLLALEIEETEPK